MPLKARFRRCLKICIRDPDLAMQYEHSAEETAQRSPQVQGKVTSLQEAALKAGNLCLLFPKPSLLAWMLHSYRDAHSRDGSRHRGAVALA